MRRQHYFWSMCLLSATSVLWAQVQTRAHAAAFQSLIMIQASAEQHLRQLLPNDGRLILVTADSLDTRLRLAACPQPLEAFLPSGANIGSRVTTGVRCTAGTQWTVYVPVSVESESPTLVLNKALARNAVVTHQDVDVKPQRIPGLANPYLKSVTELAGQRLKRDVPAGTVLGPGMFQPEVLVRRGQQVTVVATVSGIEVRTQAVALSDGSANSRIRVKNLNSAKVVEGLVDSNSMVRVDL